MVAEKKEIQVDPTELKGHINCPADAELESAVIRFSKRFNISKAEAGRTLMRDGLFNLGKKNRLVIHAHR